MKKDSKKIKKNGETAKNFRYKVIKSILYTFPYLLITIGLVLIAAPFVSRYFSNSLPVPEISESQQDESGSILGDGLYVLSANAQEEMENVPNETLIDTGHTKSGFEKSKQNQELISSSGAWTATDYAKDDIKGKLYIVQSGDTLWEISEAYFGDGNLWRNILNLNSSSIGFLPNGSQALIVPGQVLVLS